MATQERKESEGTGREAEQCKIRSTAYGDECTINVKSSSTGLHGAEE
jgi:hypothetical protein